MPRVTGAPSASGSRSGSTGRLDLLVVEPEPAERAVVPEIAPAQEVHRGRADEARHEQVLRLGENLVRRGDLLDPAVAHHGDAVGHGQGLELIVGDDHRGLGKPLQHLLDLAAHLLAQLDVEAGKGLVEQEAVGVAHDGAADGDTLFLALGKPARDAVQDVGQVQRPGDPIDAAVDLGLAQGFGAQREGQVLAHAEAGIERIELEHHGDVALARWDVVDALPRHHDLT